MNVDVPNEEKMKHLEFVQNIITRMNTNSFQLKGCMVAIVSAFLGIYATTLNVGFMFVAVVSTLLLWFLDAYYLQQERKFVGVYNDIAELTNEEERIAIRSFEMPIHKYKGGKYSYCNVLFSTTIFPLYFVVSLLLSITGLLLKCFKIS